jgi:hypothetical protein
LEGIGVGRSAGQGMAINWRGDKAFLTSSQKLAKINSIYWLSLRLK